MDTEDSALKDEMDFEIRRIGHYYSLKCSFIVMGGLLQLGYLAASYFGIHDATPIYLSLILLILPGILSIIQKRPPVKETFELSTLQKKYHYSYDFYQYRSIIFLLMLITLFVWYYFLNRNSNPLALLPIIVIIAGCVSRILSYFLFIIITKNRLMHGKI